MSALRILCLTLALSMPALASAQVFKCVDGDGRITYTNDRSLGRGCQPLAQNQAVSTVPGPAVRPQAGGSARAAMPTTGAPATAGFPRVSTDDQRTRDETRRQVLQNELATEDHALAEAEKALADEEAVRHGNERNYQKVLDRVQPFKDKVDLHKRNIEALRRELSSLK
jgi:hypothetical protein